MVMEIGVVTPVDLSLRNFNGLSPVSLLLLLP